MPVLASDRTDKGVDKMLGLMFNVPITTKNVFRLKKNKQQFWSKMER